MKSNIKFYFIKLSVIIVIVFLLQLMFPVVTEIFVLNEKAIDNHEYWRFLTAIFLHGDAAHLMYNLFALLFFGFTTERLIGSRRFLIVFFSTGILANIIAVNFYPSSLGASGAIYGILGCITIISPLMMVWAFGLLMPMFLATAVWVIADLLRIFGLFDPGNVGSIAHISGIFIGFLFGILYRKLRQRKIINNRLKIPDNYVRSWEDRYIK
mgnify:CR=1 FL=1